MALSVQYGEYVFPLSPRVTISRQPAQSVADPEAYRQTWTLAGDLYDQAAQSPTSIKAMRVALEAAFAVQSDLLWKDGETIIKALRNNLAIGGLTTRVDLPDDDTGYATHLPFRIDVSGVFRKETLDQEGGSFAGTNLFGEYTVTRQPAGNHSILRISGTLTGVSLAEIELHIDQLKFDLSATGLVLGRQIDARYNSAGVFKNVARFTIDVADHSAGIDVFDFEETVEVQNQTRVVKPRLMLGEIPPLLQMGPMLPTFVFQTGSAVGRTAYPNEQAFAAKILSFPDFEPPKIVRQSPVPLPDGSGYTGYRLSWRFAMVSDQPLVGPIGPRSLPLP